MTMSRTGIIGSFRDSNFSLIVATGVLLDLTCDHYIEAGQQSLSGNARRIGEAIGKVGSAEAGCKKLLPAGMVSTECVENRGSAGPLDSADADKCPEEERNANSQKRAANCQEAHKGQRMNPEEAK